MTQRIIACTGCKQAEYIERPLGELKVGHCLVRTEYTLISGGTVFDWRDEA